MPMPTTQLSDLDVPLSFLTPDMLDSLIDDSDPAYLEELNVAAAAYDQDCRERVALVAHIDHENLWYQQLDEYYTYLDYITREGNVNTTVPTDPF